MDAASTAFNKIMHRHSNKDEDAGPGSADAGKGGQDTATMDRNTAPEVEHETVKRRHEQREQKVLERERHQDHHKTTVQPLQEREVMPKQHFHEQAEVQHQRVNRDVDRDAEAMLERKQAQFQNTSKEAGTRNEFVQEPTLSSERTHHHLYETVQPVVEKGRSTPPLHAPLGFRFFVY